MRILADLMVSHFCMIDFEREEAGKQLLNLTTGWERGSEQGGGAGGAKAFFFDRKERCLSRMNLREDVRSSLT